MATVCIYCSLCYEYFASNALDGLSPYEFVFVRCTPDLTKLRIPDIGNTTKSVKEY